MAGAAIALADTKNKDEAAKFIQEGLKAGKQFLQERKEKTPSDWTVLELIRLASRTSAGDGLKEIVDNLSPSSKARAQLDIFQGQLERNSAKAVDSARVEEIGEDKSIVRGFAWETFARHNSRLGAGGSIAIDGFDESIRPFLHMGIALGEQDRRK